MKKSINRKSIMVKLTLVILIVILCHSLFLIGTIWGTGVISGLKNDAYSSFSEKIKNRTRYIEGEMNNRWSNISSYTDKIGETYSSLQKSKKTLTEKEIDAFLMEATPDMINMLRATMASGCFIILDDNKEENSSHSGVYIKDYDPVLSGENNGDLYMAKGPSQIAQHFQIPLDRTWSYGIVLDESTGLDVFYEPYNNAKKGVNKEALGYWQVSPNLDETGLEMITYSSPLLDEFGTPFGVIGISVGQEYLYKILPAEELSPENSMGYLLASRNIKTGEITSIIVSDMVKENIIGTNEKVSLSISNEKYNIYQMLNIKHRNDVLCYVEPIKNYDHNTPYKNKEEWVLIGMAEEQGILGFSRHVAANLRIALLVSILGGICVAFFVGRSFAQPILKLSSKVLASNPESVISLEKIGIAEIDDLSFAIERLNQDILNSTMKMDRIVSMVNMPIGVFEYKKSSQFVTVTPIIFEMLGLTPNENSNYSIEKNLFFNYIENIPLDEDEDEDIYIIASSPKKWMKIKTISNEQEILGVILDVTKETMDKYTLKFQQDYDALTGLYNRTAFQREVKRVFKEKELKIAAAIMFDLDNLKYINDTYGHDTGDNYIKSAGYIIGDLTDSNNLVARMSGDEFYAFFYGYDNQESVRSVIKHFYERLETEGIVLPNGNWFKIRMSSGIAWYGSDSNNFDELVRFADFAMYEGKHSVKGEFREFNKKNYENESFMFSGKEELNEILDNQLVEFAFQPIVSAKTGEIYGYESLMRPQSETLNSPLKLIQIATAQSKLWKVEKITLFKTLATYRKYRDLFSNKKIFINSIPNEMLKDDEIEQIEQLYGEYLENIVIEIIENERSSEDAFKKKNDIIKRWGASLALDDYGSGYNGETSLLQMLPHVVKIDRLIIEGIETDKDRRSIVSKLIKYAKERDMLILAEGIEKKSQMDYLIKMGVDLMQGYYIGVPRFMPEQIDSRVLKEIIDANSQKNK